MPRAKVDLTEASDEALLATRICDLPISISDNGLSDRIAHVWKELDDRGIHFHPECYLADEWFSPEGDPVVAIPFYLAHPRLIKLEKSQILEVEGEDEGSFHKLLRHEMGHALSHAYGLHRYKGYRKVFGPSSRPYPKRFRPKPYSRRFVLNLENAYAQIHPDEDFAETFAVWLKSGFDWREKYKGWGALKKLEFIDTLFAKVSGKTPRKSGGDLFCAVPRLKMTLATHYKRKRREYQEDFPDFFDPDLVRIFQTQGGEDTITAAAFLRKHRTSIIKEIAFWTGERRFRVRELLRRFEKRCRELGLRAQPSNLQILIHVVACLTSIVTRYFHTGTYRGKR